MEDKLGVESPKTDIYDLGAINLAPQDEETNSFTMPYDGYIYKFNVSWGSAASNTLGIRLERAGNVIVPKNYQKGEREFLGGSDRDKKDLLIKKVGEGTSISAIIYNGSTSNSLDLPVEVSVCNFNPLLLSTLSEKMGEI